MEDGYLENIERYGAKGYYVLFREYGGKGMGQWIRGARGVLENCWSVLVNSPEVPGGIIHEMEV